MSKVFVQRALIAAALAIPAFTVLPAHGQAASPLASSGPPDAGLYTSYYFSNAFQTLNWIVCGATQQDEGCYDSGTLGPFGHVGAVVEGNPQVSGDKVTRALYVVDDGATKGSVELYVYQKTDTVTPSFDTTIVTLKHELALTPLIGGAGVASFIGADNGFLFIGTSKSPVAVRVAKSNLAIETVGGFSPPIDVSAITADKYGYVTVTFGTPASGGFYSFAPNGNGEEDGGGAQYLLGAQTGLSTASLSAGK